MQSIQLFLSLVLVLSYLVTRPHLHLLLRLTELTFVVYSSTLRREQEHWQRVYYLSRMTPLLVAVSLLQLVPILLKFRHVEALPTI